MMSAPSTERTICGFCKRPIPHRVLSDAITQFPCQCCVCSDIVMIHPKCARSLCGKAIGLAPQNMDPDMFKHANVALFCYQCKLDCFYCDKEHKCKLSNHNIYSLFVEY